MRGAMGIMALLQHQLAPASSSCCTGMHALSTSPLASVPAAWLQRLLQLGQQQLPSYFSRLPLAGVAQAHGCATSSFTGLVRLYSTSSRLCSSSAVGSAASLLRVCIVGTGPAGFYTASQVRGFSRGAPVGKGAEAPQHDGQRTAAALVHVCCVGMGLSGSCTAPERGASRCRKFSLKRVQGSRRVGTMFISSLLREERLGTCT